MSEVMTWVVAAALFLTLSFAGLCSVIIAAKYAEKAWINPLVYGGCHD